MQPILKQRTIALMVNNYLKSKANCEGRFREPILHFGSLLTTAVTLYSSVDTAFFLLFLRVIQGNTVVKICLTFCAKTFVSKAIKTSSVALYGMH